MKRTALVVVISSLLLAACASVAPQQSARPEVRRAMANVTFSQVYYDGHYGRIVSGFWGQDSFFYYSTGTMLHRKDAGRHVRRQEAPGFERVRVPDLMRAVNAERAAAARRG